MKRAELGESTKAMREKTTIVHASGEQKLITSNAGACLKQEKGSAKKLT